MRIKRVTLSRTLGRLLARNGRSKIVQSLSRASAWLLASGRNFDYDPRYNGEYWLLQTIAQFHIRTLWDVGANVGTWSRAASQRLPFAEIHAFEINPAAFSALQDNTKDLPNYYPNAVGLSHRPGPIELTCFEEDITLSSMFEYPHRGLRSKKTCAVITGDSYADQHGIRSVDLLKIDVEGAEHLVLRGLEGMLSAGRIGVIQFEYGRVNVLTHFLLRDFYALFERYGYIVGKLYPGFVDFRAYHLDQEDFLGPNFVACKLEHRSYIAALSGRALEKGSR